jgi:hypothetical protein
MSNDIPALLQVRKSSVGSEEAEYTWFVVKLPVGWPASKPYF